MISGKIRALSAVMAAAMVFGAVPAAAHEHIDDLPADHTTEVRLNKPYMNFGVKAGEDVDVTDMKFALLDKNGKKVAAFTGGSSSLTVLDEDLFDFTNIHSDEDLKNCPDKNYISFDPYVLDQSKLRSPSCELYNGKSRRYLSDAAEIYINPYDQYYYYYTDTKKYQVVDTITLPANTGLADIDSEFVEMNSRMSYFRIESEEGLNCELIDKYYYFYDHAGTRKTFTADTGSYSLWAGGGWSGEKLVIYDHPVSYTKIRMKFNDAFPDLADSDLKVTKSYDFGDDPFTLVFDLRGDQSKNCFTAVYYSGSAISAPIPDKDGYVEFWVQDDLNKTEMGYDFAYIRTEPNGNVSGGGGGGSRRTVQMPKSIEDIVFPFDYPQAGFCLYNLEPGDYKLVIDNKGDSRDYRLNRDTLTVTDSRKIQRYTITVNKRPLLLGDCNRDGIIDVTDIAIIAAHVKGVKKLDGRGPLTADVDETGLINITDVSTIAAHVKGKKLIPEKLI